MASISALLSENFDDIIAHLYINEQMSAIEISEKLFSLTKIKITRSFCRACNHGKMLLNDKYV